MSLTIHFFWIASLEIRRVGWLWNFCNKPEKCIGDRFAQASRGEMSFILKRGDSSSGRGSRMASGHHEAEEEVGEQERWCQEERPNGLAYGKEEGIDDVWHDLIHRSDIIVRISFVILIKCIQNVLWVHYTLREEYQERIHCLEAASLSANIIVWYQIIHHKVLKTRSRPFLLQYGGPVGVCIMLHIHRSTSQMSCSTLFLIDCFQARTTQGLVFSGICKTLHTNNTINTNNERSFINKMRG